MNSSETQTAALKQRLSALTPAQRAQLERKLKGDKDLSHSLGQSPLPILKADPLRVEPMPTPQDPSRTVAVYPAGQGQLQMWFLQYYAPESSVYNIRQSFHLLGPLNAARLEAAFRVVIQRHDALRTTFAMEAGHLVQRVASSSDFQIEQIDLEGTPIPEKNAAAHRSTDALAHRAFDLISAPPIRVQLIRLNAEEHVLVVIVHHIISDGWSQSNLFRELSVTYDAIGNDRDPSLPPLPLHFADYSAWQDQCFRGSALDEQIAYWKTKLAGTVEPLDLATDRPRTNVSSFQGTRFSVPIEPKLWAALRALAQAEGATLFMVLLTSFKLLLHRYTGQEDIRVGVPIANRQRMETESLIGFFVNTLVMRTALSGELTFREALNRVKTTAIEAYANSSVSFEQVVESYTEQPGAARAPLLQTLFSLQDFPETTLSLPGIQSRPWAVENRTSKMDFSVAIERSGEGWSANVEYDTDLFAEDRLRQLLKHWLHCLTSIAADPSQRVADISLLTPAERRQLLTHWNETEREYPRDKCVHEIFEEQAMRTPDAIAVSSARESFTYGELNAKSDRVAEHLRFSGVGLGMIVGLSMERSFEMVIALLGILKAGGAYWAMEEGLPEKRLRLLLRAASPQVLLTRKAGANRFATIVDDESLRSKVVAIEDFLAGPLPENGNKVRVRAEDPVYVSYTSGSTGKPKGVLVPHRAVVRLVKNTNYASLDASERLLHMAPLSFDASTFELWGALLNGGRVVLMPPGQPSLTEIGETIRDQGVTTLWLSAGLFHLMVEQRIEDLRPLRQLLAGGDVLSPEHVLTVRRKLPTCRLINGYGPTENTTFTCCYTVNDEEEFAASVPIGRPVANTTAYVLDDSLEPVPIGVPGELFAGGDGVAIGYLNEPLLTAQRFLSDPFSSRKDARLYRTGDRVRRRRDGNLEFLGRVDSEVKIRGYRIELGEIEAAIREHPAVRQAVVVYREDIPGDRSLVGYVVSSNGAIATEDLRIHVRDSLPDYMVPAAFVVLDRLPLSPNGKVDRRALPRPTPPSARVANGRDQPATLLEIELANIWRRLFQRNDIERQDNFFALGGHSLLAARLVAEIDKLLGCKLPIAALFQSPTIESLGRRLSEENWAPLWSSLVPLKTTGSKAPLYMTHGWGGSLYFHVDLAHALPPDQPSYGLQAVGLDGTTPRHTSVEQMAAHYIREIRSLQPEGPYYLTGYSMGALIAFEVAQQFHRLGQRVALLALIDPSQMPAPWSVYVRTLGPFIWQRCRQHLRQWRELPVRDRVKSLRRAWSGLRYWASHNRRPTTVVAPAESDNNAPFIAGFDDYYWAVASAYRLRRYPSTIDLFLSEGYEPGFANFWHNLARGNVTVHRLQGKHLEIPQPNHVSSLAKELEKALTRARRECETIES